MTDMEFKNRIKDIRNDYLKSMGEYLDALERGDIKAALEYATKPAELIGMDGMEFIMSRLYETDTSDFEKKYDELSDELSERMIKKEEQYREINELLYKMK